MLTGKSFVSKLTVNNLSYKVDECLNERAEKEQKLIAEIEGLRDTIKTFQIQS